MDKCLVVLCDKDDEIDKFNKAMREEGLTELPTYIPLDVDQKTFDGVCPSEWFMSKNIRTWIFKIFARQGNTQEELTRYFEEYAESNKRGMLPH